jgi:hypothetical protein
MHSMRSTLQVLFCGVTLACLAALAAAAEPKSPDNVKNALHILAAVYGDMERKLGADQFDRLPHENQEFQEGSQAMRDAVADDAPDFKSRVLDALEHAKSAANHVAEVSKTHDHAQVRHAIDALAGELRKLNALFPAALRAEPGTVEPPHHTGGGS